MEGVAADSRSDDAGAGLVLGFKALRYSANVALDESSTRYSEGEET